MTMTTTKQKFYDFALMMKENSNILFNKDRNHTSVYLAGYVLEAYIKILLINSGESNYFGHLGNERFLNKIQTILSLYPEITDNILHEHNIYFPTLLFNGQGNDTMKASWDINHRYEVEYWTDSEFCQNVQKEIENVKSALILLRIDGGLQC